MNRSPSQYAGVAGVLVMGVGALIVGFSMPPEMHERAVSLRWMGAVLTVLGLLILGLLTASTDQRKAMFVAIAAAIYCGFCAYNAVSNEMSGKATYYSNYFAKHQQGEPVTRLDSPAKFRTATNVLWASSGLCLAAAVVAAVFYRRYQAEE